jgi:hypothetical protein
MAAITFSALCQYLGANTPTARRSIVKQQKYPTDGPMLSYIAAEQRIVSHLVDGVMLSTDVDQSHCKEVLEHFAANSWPTKKLTFSRPNMQQEKLQVGTVEISLKPSLLIRDAAGCLGASKLFFRKPPSEDRPQLDESVARRMASLLFYYGRDIQRSAGYAARLCSVWCVRDGEMITSTGRVSKLIDDVKAACVEIELLWQTL